MVGITKKKVITSIIFIVALFMLVVTFIFALADDTIVSVGYKEDYEENIDNGELSYTEIREKECVGYDTAYRLAEKPCVRTNVNLSYPNGSIIVWYDVDPKLDTGKLFIASYLFWEEEYACQESYEIPVYKCSEPKELKYEDKTWTLENKGHWVCGEWAAFLHKGNGYSSERGDAFKCDKDDYPIIRSGEMGWIENLKTGEKIYYSDGKPINKIEVMMR